MATRLQQGLVEFRSLYKVPGPLPTSNPVALSATSPARAAPLSCAGRVAQGVCGAASGAGIIIGTYFAFYSTAKQALRRNTDMTTGAPLPSSPPLAHVSHFDLPILVYSYNNIYVSDKLYNT